MPQYNPDAEAALEEVTIGLLAELGWDEWANCQAETAADCHLTGRQSRTQVVLPGRLRQALRRLNPELPKAALTLAFEELTRDRSTMLLPQANRHIYDLLKDGVKVTYRNEAGEQRVDTVRVINWNEPAHNDFFLAQQMWIAGDPYTRRPDLVGFVNGLPLLLFELKKHANKVKEAFEGNLSDYTAEPFVIREATETFDLNKIDFEALREQFRTGRKRTQANKLRGALNSKVQQMVRLNERRMDYLQALQEMIEAYNAGRDNVDVFFEKLLALAQDLNEEEQRAVRENLNEEELALFDILLKPRPDLTEAEIDQVKEAARELLQTLKGEKLVLDWRKQQRTRAAVQVAVEKVLDDTLPAAYDVDWYERKCEAVYDHVYEKYYGNGRSVYSQVV